MEVINKNKAVVEAFKELLRLAILAVVSWALVQVGEFNAEWAVYLTGILRFIDKWIHENPGRFNGLLPF